MALTLDLPWRGLTIPGAYIRVDHLQGGKREGGAIPNQPLVAIWTAVVGVYADPTQKTPIFSLDVRIPFDPEVAPTQAVYEALKLLPEFAGAVDC